MNNSLLPKIIVIGGPTASGKTNLAINAAQKFNGELINADSRQVYKYFNIGTNKGKIDHISSIKVNNNTSIPIVKLEKKTRGYLFDFLDPHQDFTLNEYQEYDTELKTKIDEYNNSMPFLNDVIGYSHLNHEKYQIGCFFTDL